MLQPPTSNLAKFCKALVVATMTSAPAPATRTTSLPRAPRASGSPSLVREDKQPQIMSFAAVTAIQQRVIADLPPANSSRNAQQGRATEPARRGRTTEPAARCQLTALLIEPRKSSHALLALASVLQHAPSSTCILWYHSRFHNYRWVKAQPLVAHLQQLNRLDLRPIPEYAVPLKTDKPLKTPYFLAGQHREWSNVHVRALLMRYKFWLAMPTELVLLFQSDSVLCSRLDLQEWEQFAHVGAPWPERACKETRALWRRITRSLPARPWVCPRDGRVGNSGLSLRRRSWILRAIATCPSSLAGPIQQSTSGDVRSRKASHGAKLPTPNVDCECKSGCVEDIYLAAVLHGLGAPLPRLDQAAQFAMEHFLPNVLEPTPSSAPISALFSAGPTFKMPIGFHGLHRKEEYNSWDCRHLLQVQRRCPAVTMQFGNLTEMACAHRGL